MSIRRIACLHSGSDRSREGFELIRENYDLVEPEVADVIVVLGGDGFLLRSLHNHHELQKPFYGMNRGTLGFLMNRWEPEHILERLAEAQSYDLHPLAVRIRTESGEMIQARAFNEVAVMRDAGQSANIRILVDGVERISKFVGDGVLVSTAAGSTAYNASAGGPIIPLGMRTLALTPVCPFRPRRWQGALLAHTVTVEFENLDPGKRPLIATADFRQTRSALWVTVRDDNAITARLLFDPNHALEERILREQFGGDSLLQG